MLKKLFTGIGIALLVFGGFYAYFLYAGDTSTFLSRIQNNILYTIIFAVSIVLIYILQWGNKIFRFLLLIIILINLYILWDTFFRNNIWLTSIQFITLFGLILVAIAITYITHWVRYICMSIVGLGIAFVLLTWVLPLYENMPSINDFIQSQKPQIIKQWGGGTINEGKILIKNALGSKEIHIKDLTQNDLNLSEKTQISFVSQAKDVLGKIFIDLGNGSFVHLNPQSSITLQKSWDQTIMQILQGNIEYYTPKELSGALQLIGQYKGKSIQDIQNNIRSSLVTQFEQKKEDFFINQIGGSMILNPSIDKVIKFFINTLHSISPKTYQQNLNNYNNIQQYFGKSSTGTTLSTITGENLKSIINDIMSQVKKWAGETKINQRLQ